MKRHESKWLSTKRLDCKWWYSFHKMNKLHYLTIHIFESHEQDVFIYYFLAIKSRYSDNFLRNLGKVLDIPVGGRFRPTAVSYKFIIISPIAMYESYSLWQVVRF